MRLLMPYDGNAVISDVTLGEVKTLPSTGTDLVHSGKWAYVFSGTDKIGLIYSWTMTMSGWSETDYDLMISGDNNDIKLGTPWRSPDLTAAYVPLDLDDLVDIGIYIRAEKAR